MEFLLKGKMWKTYNKVKNVFEKPILKWSFRKWRKSGLLPVWRRGNTIKIAREGEYTCKYFYARLENCEWNSVGKIKHPILSRIFKPMYQLPVWLSFYIFHHDVIWKSKYDEARFEYPPQFSIIFFGWSLNFWLINPTGDISYDDDYWEAILEYIQCKNLKEVDKILGCCVEHWGKPNEKSYRRLRNAFIKIGHQQNFET